MREQQSSIPAITSHIVGLASAPSRVSASLRPGCAGLALLTESSVEPSRRHLRDDRACDRARAEHQSIDQSTSNREHIMPEHSITPSIEVRIGRQARLFYAFVTSAPISLDAPSTITLHAAPLADIVGLAADPLTIDITKARSIGRFILVDATELTWQRARFREAPHIIAPADPKLLGLKALEKWIWQRLQTPTVRDVLPRPQAHSRQSTRSRVA
jgi:hypothetical protein